MKTLGKAELPFKLFKSGKVRDVFEVDGRLLIVSTTEKYGEIFRILTCQEP